MSHRSISLFLTIIASVNVVLFAALTWTLSTKQYLYSTVIPIDTNVAVFVKTHQSPLLAEVMLFFTHLGNQQIMVIFLIGLSLVLLLVHERLLAALFVGGLAVGNGLSTFVKNLIGRARPIDAVFNITPRSFSFPSGHAIIAIVFYGFLGYLLAHSAPKRWQKLATYILTIIVVFCIGFSRVYLGVHWATDVIGGWLIGGSVLCILILLYTYAHHSPSNTAPAQAVKTMVVLLIAIILAFSSYYLYVTQVAELRSTTDRIHTTK